MRYIWKGLPNLGMILACLNVRNRTEQDPNNLESPLQLKNNNNNIPLHTTFYVDCLSFLHRYIPPFPEEGKRSKLVIARNPHPFPLKLSKAPKTKRCLTAVLSQANTYKVTVCIGCDARRTLEHVDHYDQHEILKIRRTTWGQNRKNLRRAMLDKSKDPTSLASGTCRGPTGAPRKPYKSGQVASHIYGCLPSIQSRQPPAK